MKPRQTGRRAGGFTIIELMWVMAVVSILAVVALPVYMGYTVRAKVSEGIVLTAPIKFRINELYYVDGVMPTVNTQVGLGGPDPYRSTHVDNMDMLAGGIIDIDFSIPELGVNSHLQLAPCLKGSAILWVCQSASVNGVAARWLPEECRHVQGDSTCASVYGGVIPP